MKPIQLILRKLVSATLIAAVIFVIITGITYFISLEGSYNFKLGFPWTFYSQFKLDFLHHGSTPINFIIDFALVWGVTAGLYFFLSKEESA